MTTKETREAEDVVRKIYPLLAGRAHEVIGLVLADLLATWLASIRMGDPELLRQAREEMLELHCKAVWELIPFNEKEIDDRLARLPVELRGESS